MEVRVGSWRYGFVLFTTEVCVHSNEYVFEDSFGHLDTV